MKRLALRMTADVSCQLHDTKVHFSWFHVILKETKKGPFFQLQLYFNGSGSWVTSWQSRETSAHWHCQMLYDKLSQKTVEQISVKKYKNVLNHWPHVTTAHLTNTMHCSIKVLVVKSQPEQTTTKTLPLFATDCPLRSTCWTDASFES